MKINHFWFKGFLGRKSSAGEPACDDCISPIRLLSPIHNTYLIRVHDSIYAVCSERLFFARLMPLEERVSNIIKRIFFPEIAHLTGRSRQTKIFRLR